MRLNNDTILTLFILLSIIALILIFYCSVKRQKIQKRKINYEYLKRISLLCIANINLEIDSSVLNFTAKDTRITKKIAYYIKRISYSMQYEKFIKDCEEIKEYLYYSIKMERVLKKKIFLNNSEFLELRKKMKMLFTKIVDQNKDIMLDKTI